MSAPETMPGIISCMTTLKNAWAGVQPRSRAASRRSGSIWLSLGVTDRMTYGRLKVIWAMSRVTKPSTLLTFRSVPTKANSSASETPVTISGFVRGMLVTPMTVRFMRGPIACMPSAAMVPRAVASSEEMTATMKEFAKSGSSTPSRKSSP